MTPHFALNLSHDGIALLHRQSRGWAVIGKAELEDAGFADRMAELRRNAAELSGGVFTSKLILPNSQVLYTDIAAGAEDRAEQEARVRDALDGATPYGLNDLVYDWTEANGRLWIAVVARDTLAEAENFATQYGFNPVAFAANPEAGDHEGEAFFGATATAAGLLPEGVVPSRDTLPFRIVEPDLPPSAEPGAPTFATVRAVPEATAENTGPETSESAEPHPPIAEAEPDILPAFSSLRAERSTPPEAPAAPTGTRLVAEPRPARKPAVATAKSRQAPPKPRGGRKRKADLPPAPPPLPHPSPDYGTGPEDETDSMTVFGARRAQALPPSPRYLGLVLTLGLVVFMGVVALWSGFISDHGDDVIEIAENSVPLMGSDPAGSLDSATATGADPDIAATGAPDVQDMSPILPADGDDPAKNFGATAPPSDEAPIALTSLSLTPETAVPDGQGGFGAPSLRSDVSTEELDGTELEAEPEPLVASPLSRAEAQLAYSRTGIWQRAPDPGAQPEEDLLSDLYIASIDPAIASHDAIALPGVTPGSSADFVSPKPPLRLAPGVTLGPDGLVVPLADGALSPDGILIYAGKPQIVPPRRPGALEPTDGAGVTPEDAAIVPDAATDPLQDFRPRGRPDDLVEENERAQLGGITRAQLAALRPRTRPQSVQEQAEAARIAAEVAESVDPAAEADDPFASATKQAVTASIAPRQRPANIAQLADRARKQAARSSAREQTAGASVASLERPSSTAKPKAAVSRSQRVQPKIPSRASVAKQATVKNALALNKVSLIGVYGSSSQRRALVRLPSGRYVKVQVGDRLDGGRVSAISESKLSYKKGSRNLTIALPKG